MFLVFSPISMGFVALAMVVLVVVVGGSRTSVEVMNGSLTDGESGILRSSILRWAILTFATVLISDQTVALRIETLMEIDNV